MSKPKKWAPKILFYDLETAGVQSLKADRGYITCFGYKWSGEEKSRCLTVRDFPGKTIPFKDVKGRKFLAYDPHDDTNLLRAAREIMEEADLLVAHFGDWFDRKFVNARLRKAKLAPIPNTRQVDTCRIAREVYALSSNRLGNLAVFLGCKTGKMEKRGGWPSWWMDALKGDWRTLNAKAKYCAQDVQCLQEVFEAMKPDIPQRYLVNMSMGGVRTTPHCCPSCGGKLKRKGFYYTAIHKYQRFVCLGCGKWGRDGKALDK